MTLQLDAPTKITFDPTHYCIAGHGSVRGVDLQVCCSSRLDKRTNARPGGTLGECRTSTNSVAKKGKSLMDEVRFAVGCSAGPPGTTTGTGCPIRTRWSETWLAAPDVSGRGRLLDLACGTGQLAFALRRWFGEVWAVDSEPDMVDLVRGKAAGAGAGDVRPIVSSAETLHAEPRYFELAVVGNAFHRLDRDAGRSPAPRLAQAGRPPGLVLVGYSLDRRAGLAASPRGHPRPVADDARRPAADSRGLGAGATAAAGCPGALRRRIRAGRTA